MEKKLLLHQNTNNQMDWKEQVERSQIYRHLSHTFWREPSTNLGVGRGMETDKGKYAKCMKTVVEDIDGSKTSKTENMLGTVVLEVRCLCQEMKRITYTYIYFQDASCPARAT